MTCPPTPRRSASARPVHALITGRPNERDRRVVLVTTPRFGIVGQSQTIAYRVEDQGVPAGTTPGDRAPRRRDHRQAQRPRRPGGPHQCADPACRAEHRRDRGGAARRRADHGQQPRRRLDRGRARQAARAAGVRRAACRRARLAQPAQVRRRRRPRALHDLASAGEAGRHADPRALADRVPDPRAVPAEDP